MSRSFRKTLLGATRKGRRKLEKEETYGGKQLQIIRKCVSRCHYHNKKFRHFKIYMEVKRPHYKSIPFTFLSNIVREKNENTEINLSCHFPVPKWMFPSTFPSEQVCINQGHSTCWKGSPFLNHKRDFHLIRTITSVLENRGTEGGEL